MTSNVGRRDEALCEELKELAGRLGVRVREEVLLREVGYRVHGGLCRVRGEDVIFLDRHRTHAEHVEVLLAGLAGRDLETHYVSPALRRLLEARGAADAKEAAEGDAPADGTPPVDAGGTTEDAASEVRTGPSG